MGSVPDGVEEFHVNVPDARESVYYFVTSAALYNCPGCNNTVMYTELVQNYFGPIEEDIQPPAIGRISAVSYTHLTLPTTD